MMSLKLKNSSYPRILSLPCAFHCGHVCSAATAAAALLYSGRIRTNTAIAMRCSSAFCAGYIARRALSKAQNQPDTSQHLGIPIQGVLSRKQNVTIKCQGLHKSWNAFLTAIQAILGFQGPLHAFQVSHLLQPQRLSLLY